ncbi:MAG TPA: serine hydrolase domain-containing protein [Planctomycetota bacterium]
MGIRRPLAIFLAALALAAAAPAQWEQAIEQARKVALERLEEGHLPGLSVAVAVNGELVWAEGFGFADLENQVPVTPQSRFRIGSVSKPLTAVGLMRLVDAAKLDLDAPVQKYVPEFPVKHQGVLTTRLLTGHLAGIRHYRGSEMYRNEAFPTVAASLAIFRDDPLLAAPGERYAYSSYGWNLVSAAMEGASGEPFLEYMEARVLEPLGLAETGPDLNRKIVSRRVRFYQRAGTLLFNAPVVDNSYKWAGGGFLSTPSDLARFGSALLAGELLSKDAYKEMWTSQKTNAGEETGYGVGWFLGRYGPGGAKTRIGHGGGSIGGTTQLALYVEDGLVVAVASNLTSAGNLGDEAIARAFLAPRH